MNSRHLFRGKRLDNQRWVEGSLLVYPDGDSFICCADYIPDVLNKYEVDPTTIGQCVGLSDKNGKLIFENDIVKFFRFDNPYTGKVVFNKMTAGFEVWNNIIVGVCGEKATQCTNMSVVDEIEVIGNIYKPRSGGEV